ncbi:beta-lactamase/transpeptidase-like protein [Clathrospora elynae]|uniref:Beta-lactamase/transpeptidase-like protein n=1 Tax=Clathrospora elynae TaxID=706981 RepID=A0A6A5T4I9_9PLEO|nr:beta-lactamase/transpeptidase-like protein [Clathrospora elynae]
MADFESFINDAVAAQDIPGCVLVATNRDGSFTYANSFGSTSMKPENAKPLGLDTVMWIASCTKLMTSLCAMQLIERGQLSLDEPVYKHIPELECFTVIKGFSDAGEPIEEKHSRPITLRLLLTHSSGLAYEGTHPKALAWLKYHNRQPASSGKLLERFSCPLVFEPGESWAYGPSIDYAGLLVERITGQTLEQYMRTNLWEPLGIKDMTFFPSSRPDMKDRMADMSARNETDKVHYTDERMTFQDGEGKEVSDCMGGQGCFTSAEEYLKIIHALLTCDEEKEKKKNMLSKASLDEFFKPQLGEGSKQALNAMLQNEMANNALGSTSKSEIKSWGLGGIVLMGDSPDGKKVGTMIWGGLPNLVWWVDRKAGLCGLYAGQVLPPGDAKCAVLSRKFEKGVYEMYEENMGGGV